MPLKPRQISYIAALPAFDAENNCIYTMDPGPAKVVGINLDQKTGNMTLAWSVDQKTSGWMGLIGPANHRVLDATNIQTNATNRVDHFAGPIGANYKGQVTWRDPNTRNLQPPTTSAPHCVLITLDV